LGFCCPFVVALRQTFCHFSRSPFMSQRLTCTVVMSTHIRRNVALCIYASICVVLWAFSLVSGRAASCASANAVIYQTGTLPSALLAPFSHENLLHLIFCLVHLFVLGKRFAIDSGSGSGSNAEFFSTTSSPRFLVLLALLCVLIFACRLGWSFLCFRVFGWSLTQLYMYYPFHACTSGLSAACVAAYILWPPLFGRLAAASSSAQTSLTR
jgi:hypothetical protein